MIEKVVSKEDILTKIEEGYMLVSTCKSSLVKDVAFADVVKVKDIDKELTQPLYLSLAMDKGIFEQYKNILKYKLGKDTQLDALLKTNDFISINTLISYLSIIYDEPASVTSKKVIKLLLEEFGEEDFYVLVKETFGVLEAIPLFANKNIFSSFLTKYNNFVMLSSFAEKMNYERMI